MNARKILVASLLAIGGASLATAIPVMTAVSASAQGTVMNISGTVLDQTGEPVIGATVMEKGSTNGTSTDVDGNFTIKVKPGSTLIISYVGCTTVEVKAEPDIKITLKDESSILDEVVVVGFGTQKKVNLTGAVSVATAKDIADRPVKNATEALQGIIPGLQLTRNAGDVETNMSINIRGIGTIGQGSNGSPLILIDGMEGDINTVNPSDIETVSVLKDAAASSIYGSRAPFGVILITTKKGSEGKVAVNYTNNFRWASPIGLPQSMNSYDFANYYNEAAKNAEWGAIYSDDVMRKMLEFQANGGTNKGGLPTNGEVWGKPAGDPFTEGYANTDWYSELYRDNVFSMEHNASVSGGNANINYYASLGYLDYNGLLRHGHDGQKRYNATGKFSAKLASWVTFNYSTRFVRTDTDRPNRFGNGFYEMIGRQTWPNLPVYDENGYYFNSNADTPAMQLALGGTRKAQRDQLYQQAGLIFEPIKNWITHVEFNYSTDNTEVRQTNLPYYNHKVNGDIDNTNGTSSLYQSLLKNNYMNWNIFSDYSFSIKEDNNFKVMLGFQSEEMRQSSFWARAYGLQDTELPELDLMTGLQGNGAERAPEVGGARNQWSIMGFFGRINYDYKGRYLFEGNLRYDGSSRFRSGKRWTWTPSFSLGWNIAQENFWETILPYVNMLKLRASYGSLANQNTDVWYPTYRTMTIGQANGNWLIDGKRPATTWVNGLVSSSLTWEKVRTWNFGLDWGLFNNRLQGSFETYIRYTDDMVGPALQLPATLGLSAPAANNCDLKTNGWELTLSWRDVTAFGLSYGVSFNLSDARTYIRNYPGNTTNSIWNYVNGREINEIWGFETVGIAKSKAEMDAHLEKVGGQSALGDKWNEGDIMYADLDGKPGINMGDETIDDHGDLKVIVNSTPRFFYG
ncbi:MAG: TonB-dependent receptor, partial [Muribaculaceae bacterium]|nr:TonB-dependent receptor [Muribaculaceae bacterium]